MRYICADFETCDDRLLTGGEPTKVRVWAWAACDTSTLATDYGDDIASFIAYMEANPATYYFHNLAFDGTHILDYILRDGWERVECGRRRKLAPRTFTTLISKTGKFYRIQLGFSSHTVDICDSLKKIPLSVRAIARKFGLPEGKGEIDYRPWRPEGYHMDDVERDYIRRDVQIVARAISEQLSQGHTKLTIGSDCMDSYKQIIGKRYSKWFPVLNPIQDQQIRAAYRGGYVRVDDRYAGVDVYGGISVDYNSMYPSQMIAHPFPCGRPRYFAGRYERDDRYPLYVQRLTCMFRLKDGGLPMVQLRGGFGFGAHEYVREVEEPVSLTMTSVDLEIMESQYDVDVMSYDGGYKFQQATGMFDEYLDFWREIKERSTGGERQIAKLFSNNLYGKFGTNPDATSKIPELVDGVLRLETGKQELRDPVYIPVAVFITAYARQALFEGITANRERFIYCDTDSMHLAGTDDPKGIRLHDTSYGAWKVEGAFKRARHIRAKCYIWDLNGKLGVRCAGMPDNIKAACDFDNFRLGFSNYDRLPDGSIRIKPGLGKLRPVMVPGGRTLVDSPYMLH